MSGGSCLDLVLQTYKSLQFGFLAKLLPLWDVSENWSVFEQLHIKRRNRLEHQRLNDLVYVHYNYQLKERYINLVQLFKYY